MDPENVYHILLKVAVIFQILNLNNMLYIFYSGIKLDCNSPGSASYDPRFIGGDDIIFYFHGKSNQHFSLVSDQNIQINARFIGHRPTGRTRDFTWIQALGPLFNSHTFSLHHSKVYRSIPGVSLHFLSL